MTVPMLRTSERRSFRRCPQQWWWRYREGLDTRGTSADALWFGTGIHMVLAHIYQPGLVRGAEPLEVWRGYVQDDIRKIRTESTGSPVDDFIAAGELGEAMITNYLEKYDGDPTWDVFGAERTFQIEIPRPGKKGGSPLVIYVGTFDGAYRDLVDGKIWLMEHKTAKSIQTKHLPLDDQAGSYWAVATDVLRHSGDIGPKERLAGITYNFLRKGVKDTRPLNDDGKATNKPTKDHYLAALEKAVVPIPPKAKVSDLEELAASLKIQVVGEVSAIQPAPLFLRESVYRRAGERKTQIERIQKEAIMMNGVKAGTIPLLKNPSDDCAWCQFYNMCLLDESGGDVEEYKKLVYTVRDPYADHRQEG